MIKGTNHGSVGNNLANAADPGRELVLDFIRHPANTTP
jgi:hypothetical protein